VNWKYEGVALDASGVVGIWSLSRFVVIGKNPITNLYVGWGHLSLDSSYATDQYALIATATSPTGPFTIVNTIYQPDGEQFKDPNSFLDDDGASAYISYVYGNQTGIRVNKLAADWLSSASSTVIGSTALREATAICRKGSVYFLLSCAQEFYTRSLTNDVQYATSSDMTTWSSFAAASASDPFLTIFNAQCAGIFKRHDDPTKYIYVADGWSNGFLDESAYVWAEVQFPTANTMAINYQALLQVSVGGPSLTLTGSSAGTLGVASTLTITTSGTFSGNGTVTLTGTGGIYSSNPVIFSGTSQTLTFTPTSPAAITIVAIGTTSAYDLGSGSLTITTPNLSTPVASTNPTYTSQAVIGFINAGGTGATFNNTANVYISSQGATGSFTLGGSHVVNSFGEIFANFAVPNGTLLTFKINQTDRYGNVSSFSNTATINTWRSITVNASKSAANVIVTIVDAGATNSDHLELVGLADPATFPYTDTGAAGHSKTYTVIGWADAGETIQNAYGTGSYVVGGAGGGIGTFIDPRQGDLLRRPKQLRDARDARDKMPSKY
jgi:hypothetical protein